MASYTMQLRTMVEMPTQNQPNLSIDERIAEGRKYIFDFEYPIFDEDYRAIFESHFIQNFYFSEIGFETEFLFKMRLRNWMNINMPAFNKLFSAALFEFDPFTNVDWTESFEQNKKANANDSMKHNGSIKSSLDEKSLHDGSSTSDSKSSDDLSSSSTNFKRDVFADTPDTRLKIDTDEGKGVLEYASTINEATGKDTNKSSEDSTSNTKIEQTDETTKTSDAQNTVSSTDNNTHDFNELSDYVKKFKGKQGNDSYAKMLKEFESSIIRVEAKMFYEMNELFMLVY